jgi:hypothetical protein
MIYMSFNNQDFLNFVPCWGGAWPSSLRFSQRTEMGPHMGRVLEMPLLAELEMERMVG